MKTKKQVRERSNCQAFVILNPKGEHVATVQSLHTNSAVQVDVWGKYELNHQGKAGGYGYDKFTSALSGCIIDNYRIFNHCGTDELTVKILNDYHADKISEKTAKKRAELIGARFANFGKLGKKNKYGSLYYESGLERLRVMGYNVIQAI